MQYNATTVGLASVLTPCQCVIQYPRNIQIEWFSQNYCVFMLESSKSGLTYLAATHPELEKVQFIHFSYNNGDIRNVYKALDWNETALFSAEDRDTFYYKTAPSLLDLNYFLERYKVS
ncbi:hypothetical protein [Bacillus horti]|uniref:Uncharacterized protein n=1 Tax=Caldalkalibacillus horti TaxID=77523 RepID=A0ABT9VUJ4_9BACI|nr:hypothetical protein [Bacillus horti]MDQ0164507.1 hypothetical protein [Bacillus horti]